MSKIRILLLTNRDSDNVGDQLIEATAISLLKSVMSNLQFDPDEYTIASRAAGIISKQYMKTEDPELLKPAREAISNADVVVFGGAPLFNYSYQSFYKRTIVTLQLAQEYSVPVLFSSIGVEKFDPTNPRSVELKDALALSVVRQITTRDDLASLRRYVEGTKVEVGHVSDPAVFADVVFGDVPAAKRAGETRKRVGLVVTRAGIFKDNGITFTEADQRRFWLQTMQLLEKRGYDVKLFTTGHFTDEVFLDRLVRRNGIPAHKAAVTVNSPEELISELSACDGIIAYRLHASIAAFAYEIPAIGLSWNFKVPYFYESVGHGDRALDASRWTAEEVVPALEKAMSEGVVKDETFLVSVYETLFAGMKSIFAPDLAQESYSYAELRKNLPPYGGTGPQQYKEKVIRKLRRIYDNYPVGGRQPSAPAPTLTRRAVRKAKRLLARFR